MPIHEYRCHICTATFELLVRDDKAIACPECGSSGVEKLISAPFVSKGLKAPQPNCTCCGREEQCVSPPCIEDGTCPHR